MNFLRNILVVVAVILIIAASCNSRHKAANTTWEVYGGSKQNTHYSALKQIDTSNVRNLQLAWVYHTHDSDLLTQIQVNPIIVDGILYGVSPKLRLFALDAATGEKKWSFDPVDTTDPSIKAFRYFAMNVCRGVTYYTDGDGDKRIFYGASSYLYCFDALTGKPITTFGDNGKVDLHNDLGRDVKDLYVVLTSPGIIYKDMIIIGDRVNEEAAAAPGHVRAYDVHTGKLRWIFHTIPQPGEPGYETWDDKEAWKHIGGANVWSGFSMDEARGIVFGSTGSASYDFYGGRRLGSTLYANSILALDAATGKLKWHFQSIHHDLWDKDLSSPPVMVTITKNGKKIDAIAQSSKTGFVFVLNRETGEPLYPIHEVSVPSQSELNGEKPWPTQPEPELPKPFARQVLTEQDLNRFIPDSSYQDIRKRLAGYKTGNMFNPPSKEGTIIFPGYDGGGEYGGPSYDPEAGILYINSNEMAWVLTMLDNPMSPATSNQTNLQAGNLLYITTCMGCHGPQRQGSGNYPTLINVNKKYNKEQFIGLISEGRRMMPAFKQLGDGEKEALASFILDIKAEQQKKFIPNPNAGDPYWKLPYESSGYYKFLTKEGYPAVAPPWGTLNAIDLNTGQYVWKDTLGDYPELKAKGIHSGTENYGGSAITAGGLLFIAATSDEKFRAYNKRTGQLLWETDLPAGGFATPSIYEVHGKEYVVIACGGGKLRKKSGDAYVVFDLRGKQ